MAHVALERTTARMAHRRLTLPPIASWFYLLPAVIFFLGWQLLPIFRVAWFSFTDYRFVAPPGTSANWIGFDNYRKALDNPLVRSDIVFSLRWLMGVAGTEIVLGTVLLAIF